MATLQAGDIINVVRGIEKDLGKHKFTDIASELQDHIAFNQLINNKRLTFKGGRSIQWDVRTTYSGAAKNVGLYQEDDVNVSDTLVQAEIPWRHTQTNWAVDKRIISMGTEAYEIVNTIKEKRTDAMGSLAVLMEGDFWGKPTNSSDNSTPYGIEYWIVYNATTGFNGGLPSGFTSVAGLAPATYTQWRNWTANYTTVNKIDLIRKMREAATKTNFRAPKGAKAPDFDSGATAGYYAGYGVIGPMEEVLEDQNDNLGNNVASKDGMVLFRQAPVTYVPQLDLSAPNADPVYGIDWGVMGVSVLKGEYMRKTGPQQSPKAHNTLEAFIDLTWNLLCRNRRKHFLIAKSDPVSG